MDQFDIDENPEKLIIPLEISKVIYDSWNAELVIMDKPDQVYGKALHGNGKICFKNGNVYEGEIVKGMMHGNGKFNWANGVIYQGQFNYNAIEGKGVYTWTDGSEYEGEVKASLRYGKGIFKSPNNEAIYEGDWVDGLRQGIGKITFKSGAIYEGDFNEGKKHGQGKMTYVSENFYDGSWEEDKKCGFGTMNWVTEKEKYYGNWKNNLQNGYGVHIWLEQKGEGKLLRNRYEGEWKDGQRNGYGTFYYANGSKYEGEWKNNLKEGYAVFTEDNGNITQGIFKADRFVKEKAEEQNDNIIEANSVNDSQSDIAGEIENKMTTKEKKELKSQQEKLQKTQQLKPKQNNNNSSPTKKNQLQSQQSQQNQILQKDNNNSSGIIKKKKEIEVNPFTFLIDLNDLTLNVDDDIERIHRDTQNMLLRHNTYIKQWYKAYSQKYENGIGEDAFAMDLATYWKFIKECKVCDSSLTLAALNRLFYKGVKNNFNIKQSEGQISKQIELLKKLGRKVTLEELQDIQILNLALDSSQQLNSSKQNNNNIQSQQDLLNNNNSEIQQQQQQSNRNITSTSDRLDWNKLEELESQEENIDIFDNRQFDIHNGSRVILFRHFVELIVRTSYLKYGKIQELHRSLERLIETKLKPNFEKISLPNRPQSTNSVKSTISDRQQFVNDQSVQDNLQLIYDSLVQDNKNQRYGVVDKTVKFKNIVQLLEKSEYLQSDSSTDRQKSILVLEHLYDSESTIAHVEQLQKEEIANQKKKKPKKGQLQSQQVLPPPTMDYERIKAEKMTKMMESELIFPEFAEYVVQFLFKFQKDLQINKEGEIQKRLLEHFKKIQGVYVDTSAKAKSKRSWPQSVKDKEKNSLALQRVKEQKDAEEKKKKEQEKRREGRERAKMQLEDCNIPSDAEEEDDDNF